MSDSDETLVAAPGERVPGTIATSMELGAGYGITSMDFKPPQQREVPAVMFLPPAESEAT